MSRKQLVGIALGAVAVLLVGWQIAQGLRGPSVPAVKVARQAVEQRVVAMGRVAPLVKTELGALVTGQVLEVLVDEGDEVQAGQLLARIDSREATAAFNQAVAQTAQAEARWRQFQVVEAPTAAATLLERRQAFEKAGRDLERAENLFGTQGLAQTDLDQARLAWETARRDLRVAEAEAQSAAPGGGGEQLARANLAQARAATEQARARLSYTQITAPADGLILIRHGEPGDTVQPGTTLFTLALKGETQLVVQAEERNLALLRVGQNALASADAFSDRTFAARIVTIAPSIDPDRGTVEIKLAVPDPPAYLKAEMTVSVDVEVAAKATVLAVPIAVLREPVGDSAWVLVVRDGRAAKQSVRLGMRGERVAQIMDGLVEGEAVLLTNGKRLAPGARVRPDLREQGD